MTGCPNRQQAHGMIEALVRGGVNNLVASPGSRSTPLLLAAAAHPNLEVRMILDERTAAFVSLGLARATDTPVALLCTSGSAGAHHLPAVIEANHSRVPLLVLTADRPAELHDCGAPQTVHQTDLFAGQVRYRADLAAPPHPDPTLAARCARSAATKTARALAATVGSPKGPAHLNVRFRKPLWTPEPPRAGGPNRSETPTAPVVRPATRAPAPGAVAEVVERLRRAERGLIVVGPRPVAPVPAAIERLHRAVEALSTRLGWPVLADPASNLRFRRRDGGVFVDQYDLVGFGEDPAPGAALRPDFVLRLGQAPTSKHLVEWLANTPDATTVLLDEDARWHDPDHTADLLVGGDLSQTCEQLLAALEERGARRTEWRAAWVEADRTAAAGAGPVLQRPDWEGAVARSVVGALPGGAALHLGSSMPIRDVDAFCRGGDRDLVVYASRGANGIDGLVATAFGEALGSGRPTCLLLGDLSFLHDISSVVGLGRKTDVRLSVVVIDNNGGGIFEFLPIAAHSGFEPLFATPSSADLAALAEASGARFVDCDVSQLANALADDLERAGVGVIRVRVDRRLNVERHREVRGVPGRARGGGRLFEEART